MPKEKLFKPGEKYGRLVILENGEKDGPHTTSVCRCECGTVKTIRNHLIRKGSIRSCGCLARDKSRERAKGNTYALKHGGKKSSTYNTWYGMVARCENPGATGYAFYGGRGIKVCPRWADREFGFIRFVEDMGERPSAAYSIDRIDPEDNYTPENCRWATRSQQSTNTRKRTDNSTGLIGVCKRTKKTWTMYITVNGKRLVMGGFKSQDEAALAYNVASMRLHGEFGKRNPLPPMKQNLVTVITARVNERLKELED